MAAKLTNEQRDDLAANPHQAVPVVDEKTGKTYYVCDEAFLFGEGKQGELSRQQLKALIEEGIASGKVEKEEAHARMRATIERYRNADA